MRDTIDRQFDTLKSFFHLHIVLIASKCLIVGQQSKHAETLIFSFLSKKTAPKAHLKRLEAYGVAILVKVCAVINFLASKTVISMLTTVFVKEGQNRS